MAARPDPRRPSDEEVVRWAREGREEGYVELVRRYWRPVLFHIYGMVHDRDLAKDLTQETFVKVVRALPSQRQGSSFSAWVFRIAHRTALDHLRKKQPPMVPLEDPALITPRHKVDPDARHLSYLEDSGPHRVNPDRILPALERALKQLRTPYRRCILLRFAQGRSYEEISRITGLPVGTVKSHAHRGMKELREMLGPLLEGNSDPFWGSG